MLLAMRRVAFLLVMVLTACQGPGLDPPSLKTRGVFEPELPPILEVEAVLHANRPTDALLNLGGGIQTIQVRRGDQVLPIRQEWIGPALVTVQFGDRPPAGPVTYAFIGLDASGRVVATRDAQVSVDWTSKGEAPVIGSPEAGAEVGVRPVIRWQEVPGAAGYVVRLTRPPDSLVEQRSLPPDARSFQPLSDLPVGTHQVRVSAFWSESRSYDDLRVIEARSATRSFAIR